MTDEYDALDDILGEDDDATGGEEPDQMAALTARLEEMEKANKGLLKEVQKERKGRQDFQGRFNELSETVTQALENRKGAGDDEPASDKSNGSDKLMIEFDGDGNPYIPATAVNGSNEEIMEYINTLAEAFKGNAAQQTAQTEANRAIQNIVGRDDRFPKALSRVEDARNYLNNKIIEYQKANGLQGGVSSSQAIQFKDQLFDSEEYASNFGDVDMVQALRAMDTEHDLTAVLNEVAEKIAPAEVNMNKTLAGDPISPQFKKALQKPSGLGRVENQKGSQLDVSEKLSSLSSLDIIDGLSDADADKITQALLREERQHGIKM